MENIAIRTIQHYLYCPHRWGLMEIDCAWAENGFVVKADLLHERVHSGKSYMSRGKENLTDVSVWNDELGIYGKLDCLEKTRSGYCIVEYKPTMPKSAEFNFEDALQVFAQKICADQIFSCSCSAAIYYADKKKRILLPFEEQYDFYFDELKKILDEMRYDLETGLIPSIRKDQNCSGCSMKDLCMPEMVKKPHFSLRKNISSILEDNT